jgi:hypothetical protein
MSRTWEKFIKNCCYVYSPICNSESQMNTAKHKNLLWFKVDIILEKKINKIISNQWEGNFLFYSWRDSNNASSCFL